MVVCGRACWFIAVFGGLWHDFMDFGRIWWVREGWGQGRARKGKEGLVWWFIADSGLAVYRSIWCLMAGFGLSGWLKARNAQENSGIRRNMQEYVGIRRNRQEYAGMCRNAQ